jgi:hypothetical protein
MESHLGPEVVEEMTPIRKLNDGGEDLRADRYQDLRRVKRRDYHDSGGSQRQFQELVEEFNSEEQQKSSEREKDADKAELKHGERKKKGVDQLDILQKKASYRIKKSKDGDIGAKVDIKG